MHFHPKVEFRVMGYRGCVSMRNTGLGATFLDLCVNFGICAFAFERCCESGVSIDGRGDLNGVDGTRCSFFSCVYSCVFSRNQVEIHVSFVSYCL